MKVRVTTVDVKTGEQQGRSRVVDYSKDRARSWLANHIWFAVNNGLGVAINAVADEQKPEPDK
jgi:hypothetical protein